MAGDLTGAQITALDALSPIIGDDFYLVGGVAVALYLHHRQSRDLYLFTSASDPVRLEERLGQLPNAAVTDRAEGTLHVESWVVDLDRNS